MITLCEAVRNCMLFTDSLGTSEVPKREQYDSTINMPVCLICKYLIKVGACCL